MFARPLAGPGSGGVTAGPDWEAVRRAAPAGAGLTYPDEADFARYLRTVEAFGGASGGAGAVVRDLDHARNACAKPRFNLELCTRDRKAHQCVRARAAGRLRRARARAPAPQPARSRRPRRRRHRRRRRRRHSPAG
jgi:hypothetical protein